MKQVIITGAYGFIGQRLVKELTRQGVRVYAIYRGDCKTDIIDSNLIPVECDMENISYLEERIEERSFDAFYHLAWDGGSGVSRTDFAKQLQNVKYVCDTVQVAKILNCKRLIVTGTISENIVWNSIAGEYTSQNLIYAIAKDSAHRMLDYICRKEDQEYCWVRLSNVIGEDDLGGNIIAYTIRSIKNKRIPEYGPCDQLYDFIYIDDVVEALINLGKLPFIRSQYTISSGNPRILREYLERIADKLQGSIGINKRKSDGVEYKREWFDNSVALRDLVMQDIHSFETALETIIG